MTTPSKIALIGYGKMGQALHKGWVNAGLNANYTIIAPTASKTNPDLYPSIQAASNALKSCDIILLAVKPQIMATICEELKPLITPKALIISIAVGQTLQNLTTYFSPKQPIIRVMPNTPSAIGKGVSGLVANSKCSATHKEQATRLFTPSGTIHWLDNETLINSLAAISGSGPAYLFYFIEALTKAAKHAGLPDDLAATLARNTITGSAALAEANPQSSATTLRQNVTSPGGTTQAALSRLMDGELQQILNQAITKAIKRGEELSG